MSTTRYFVVEPGRVFIPPKGLLSGPGRTARKFDAGELVEMPEAKVDRFVRGRKSAGDIREVTPTEAGVIQARLAAAAAAVTSSPPAQPTTPAAATKPVKEG